MRKTSSKVLGSLNVLAVNTRTFTMLLLPFATLLSRNSIMKIFVFVLLVLSTGIQNPRQLDDIMRAVAKRTVRPLQPD